MLDGDGEVIARREFRQVMTSWRRLFEALGERFPSERYHADSTYLRFEQDADRVVAHFADGSQVEGELLISADGNRSTIRSQVMPDVRPRYPGYIAWRCLVDETALETETHEALFGRYTIYLPRGHQGVGYPVPEPDHSTAPGRREYNVVWYHAVPERDLGPMLIDADGTVHVNGIPPALIRDEVRAHMRLTARAALPPQFAEAVERARIDFFQPIADLECPGSSMAASCASAMRRSLPGRTPRWGCPRLAGTCGRS